MSLITKLKYLLGSKPRKPMKTHSAPSQNLNLTKVYTGDELACITVDSSLRANLARITDILGHNVDLVVREFTLGEEQPLPAVLLYLDSMIDSIALDREIMSPLLEPRLKDSSGADMLKLLRGGGLVSRAEASRFNNYQEIISNLLMGEVVIFIDGYSEAFVFSCKGYPSRSIAAPDIEKSVRGPRDAFTESMTINLSMIRRRLITPNLVIENKKIGKVSSTSVALVYLKGIAASELVDEVRRRLAGINIDALLDSSYVEHLIQDSPYSPFPQLVATERPDRVAGGLLEGRIALVIDNTPFVLVAPGELVALLDTPEDHYTRFYYGTFIRWVRFASFGVALLLPSLYIAITNYHQEMIPTTLFISIAAARQGVPFPAFLEALMMEVTFEVLREAGIRLPSPVGQAVSITGALVIGQAAVQANLVSPLMIIVVAFTAIATFTIPQYSLGITIRLLRFPLMIIAAFLGLFGVMTAFLAILLHLCSIRSFGVPYLTPITPAHTRALTKNTLVMAPLWSRDQRPPELVQDNVRKQGKQQRPEPPKKGGG